MRAVLMLHGVDESRSPLSIPPRVLARLVAAIRSAGHAIVPLGALLSEPGRQNQVALTFDDGLASVARAGAPVLRELGVRATLFLTTDRVGADNHWPSQPRSAPVLPMMSWDDVEALHAEGWEIESHTSTHPDLRSLSDTELERELEDPRREIERRLGRAPRAFAYPYGLLDERSVAAVGSRYRYAVTTRTAQLTAGAEDLLRIPRIDVHYLRWPALTPRFGSLGFRSLIPLLARYRRWTGHEGEAR